MTKSASRFISLSHLTFYRHWLEGIDSLGSVAERYLETGANEAAAKRTLATIQQALSAAAIRRGKYGQARLLSLPKERLRNPMATNEPDADKPSFEQFQAHYDPERHFNVNEIREIYEDFYPSSRPAASTNRFTDRDQRLRARRIALVNELAPYIASAPVGTDPLQGWFDHTVAARLNKAELYTLNDLAHFMNHHGYRFFSKIERVGPIMGAKLREFIIEHEESIGIPLSAYACKPRSQMTPDDLRAVHALHHAESTVDYDVLTQNGKVRPIYSVTFGDYSIPDNLNGEYGANRAPNEKNRLQAKNDMQAVSEWLSLQQGNWLTYRSYMKEAQRLHAWAILSKSLALSDLTSANLAEYRAFLRDPQPRAMWVADKAYERFHQAWRPFVVRHENQVSLSDPDSVHRVPIYGLSDRSIKQAFTILKRLFNWLTGQRYLETSPMNGISPDRRGIDVQVERNLKQRQMHYILDFARQLPIDDIETPRTQFILHLAYTTGLRLHELAKVRIGDIVDPGFTNEWESARQLKVIGKGGVTRLIPIPRSLLTAIVTYLKTRGISEAAIHDPAYAHIPLIGRLTDEGTLESRATPLSTSVLYRSLKRFFGRAAAAVPKDRARELNPTTIAKASTHWLRHSHGSHVLANGASLTTVQANLGHKSLQTTSLYLHSEDITRQKEMELFDQQFFGSASQE